MALGGFWADLDRELEDPEFRAAYEAAWDEVALIDRIANDGGARHELDDVIAAFGFTRDELEADDQ